MKLPRLLQTTAVRFALRYSLYYLLILGATFAAFRWTASLLAGNEVSEELKNEFVLLDAVHAEHGSQALISTIAERERRDREGDRLYIYLSDNGERLAGNLLDWPWEADIETDGRIHNVWVDESLVPGRRYEDDAWLPAIAEKYPDGSRLLVLIGVEQAAELQELTEFLVEVLSVSVVLGLALSLLLSHTIMRRLQTVQATAADIMQGDLSRRIPVSPRADEFDALATQLNAMLDRIQLLVRGIRNVTDSIAHDLRSPLTRMRNRMEVTLLEEREPAEYRQALRQGIRDAEELVRVFNALLSIARVEAGNHRDEWVSVDLPALLHDLGDLYEPAAGQKRIRLELDTEPCAPVTGSRDLLAQALGNLLENAIKYTPDGGRIGLSLQRDQDGCTVTVSDTGPGIPAVEREHVLQRFVRLDNSRHTEGNGLGLSLVSAVAVLHGATLRLADAEPGLRVTLHFPAATHAGRK